ncbi:MULTISPECIES: ABC transporter substrate-binding protein [unclassified Sulfurospirillum]|uniref:ABC transporter substrate-binding protein n=1 Tax=unclassified Sulfurospirillum TaxID=2618290 RepID=UPI000507C0FE|nr:MULTISPECIES: ABC transporter substrate-binding protein [unclassified Sulfurospirillum]KFL33228.1 ABC transporter substrate-binding protein [Sulfurospirillum sp. SCADC]
MEKIILCTLIFLSSLCAQTYTDMLGRHVEINRASTLVFLGPGALRLGVYLGLEERLVGIEKTENDVSALSPYRTFLGQEKIAKLPLIGPGGPGKMPDLEALIQLKPDLIITSFVDQNQIDLITSKTAIPVLAVSYGASYGGTSQKNLEEIKASLLLLGEVTHTQERAQTLTAFMHKEEKALAALKLSPQTLYVGGIGYKGSQGMTSTEANYPPFELLGLKNSVFAHSDAKGHQFIELEALLKADPEIIFIDLFGKANVEKEYAEKKPLFDSLQAYRKRNVKEVIGYNYYSTNIENLFVIAWQVAHALGAPVEMNAKANEIFSAFYGEKADALLAKLPYHLNQP